MKKGLVYGKRLDLFRSNEEPGTRADFARNEASKSLTENDCRPADERTYMDDKKITDRLEIAVSLLERTLGLLEEKQGDVERISATVEETKREIELTERLAAAEREIAELKAAAVHEPSLLRRTVPASTTEMLAKHGIGEGPVDVRTLDAALSGLSLEQRIAVKTQLMRAGSIA
ncbi:MAG TPA: hypothetical protein VN753_00165 [Terracidiphilus sp.]|nr:hypothetical protein [Terracidiphilus sp.]